MLSQLIDQSAFSCARTSRHSNDESTTDMRKQFLDQLTQVGFCGVLHESDGTGNSTYLTIEDFLNLW